MVLAGDVAFLALISRSADERIGLAGRSADQDDVSARAFANLVEPRVQTKVGIFLAKFQLPRFGDGCVPLSGKFGCPVGFAAAIVQELIVAIGKPLGELAQKSPQAQRRMGGKVLLDGKCYVERARAVTSRNARKPFGQSSRTCKYVDDRICGQESCAFGPAGMLHNE